MWFFEQLSGGMGAFNIALGVRLTGELNVSALEQTFSEIMRRHEGLRSIFPEANSQPIQIIQAPASFTLPFVDLSRLTNDQREAEAARIAREETLRPFNLATGPLVRPSLLRLKDDEHIIICTMHHIIGDGQSFEVVIAEMSQIYSTFTSGQPSPLAELSVQYVDYAAWQQQLLQGEELEKRLAYWRQQLADAPTRLNLPHARSRPKVQKFGGTYQPIKLSPELTDAIRELSRREGLTLYMTMLSAFVLLLNQYTDDEDIVVGSVYANRERVEAEKVFGILANTLVLRVDLSGTTTFRDVMKQVRQVCLDAYTWQLSPELIREDLAKRGEERERLFDVWFQFERQRQEELSMSGLTTSWYDEGKEITRFELSLSLGEAENEILGKMDYDDRIFSAQTTAQMIDDYISLLKLMTANPEKNLAAAVSQASAAAAVANLEL
jgi:hypothetical protein